MKKLIFSLIILMSISISAIIIGYINNYSYPENFLMLSVGALISFLVLDKLED